MRANVFDRNQNKIKVDIAAWKSERLTALLTMTPSHETRQSSFVLGYALVELDQSFQGLQNCNISI